MTKQEEIREGITDIIKESIPNFIYPFLMIPTRWLVNKILSYLHSQGVVIKMDRELPPLLSREIYDKKEMKIAIKQAGIILEAGYVAVEPLIKE